MFAFSNLVSAFQRFTCKQGRIKVVCGPWLKLRKGPFLNIKSLVNREKINERTEVFVVLKQNKLEQKNESSTDMDVTI